MAKEDNLKPFQKGFDPRRNIEGRPQKIRSLDALLEEVVGDHGMSAVLEKLQGQALKGNVFAAGMLLDRQYGKPKQSVDISQDVKGELTYTRQIIKNDTDSDVQKSAD